MPVKEKVALATLMLLAGAEFILTVAGAVVGVGLGAGVGVGTIEKFTCAVFVFPALSVALILKTCAPIVRFVKLSWVLQVA